TIINNDLADATGTFSGLPEGKVFSATTGSFTGTFQITYQGGDGNDVVLRAVSLATPTALQGTPGNDAFVVVRNGNNDDISLNGNLIFSTSVASLNALDFSGLGGADTLTIDSSQGNPFPSGGIAFHGGNNSGDKLVLTGGSF